MEGKQRKTGRDIRGTDLKQTNERNLSSFLTVILFLSTFSREHPVAQWSRARLITCLNAKTPSSIPARGNWNFSLEIKRLESLVKLTLGGPVNWDFC